MSTIEKKKGKHNVFMFSGQGSQYFRMGEDLYQSHSVFRQCMSEMDQLVKEKSGFSIVSELYKPERKKSESFNDLSKTHPAIVMVEFALAKTLIAEGIKPDLLLGSSLGEFSALAIAGAFDTNTLLDLVLHQSSTLESSENATGMTAVICERYVLDPIIQRNNCEIAGINSKQHFIIAGRLKDLEQCHMAFNSALVSYQPLAVNQGFHSSFLESEKAKVLPFISSQDYSQPQLPVFSCASKGALETFSPEHLWNVIRKPMMLTETLDQLFSFGELTFIDISPSSTLSNFVRINKPQSNSSKVFPVLDPFGSDLDRFNKLKNSVIKLANDKPKLVNKEKDNKPMKVHLFPGQGSQHPGMGKSVFDKYPEYVEQVDVTLGYSIKDLCLKDAQKKLSNTQYTQPALYVVECLSYLEAVEQGGTPDVVVGHSLGEYSALFAAGVFDFQTGLKLVKKRGELMADTGVEGRMTAVLNMEADKIASLLKKSKIDEIDIANYNKPSQTVIAGPGKSLAVAERILTRGGANCVPLNVSAPFHSRYMEPVVQQFSAYLDQFEFSEPKIRVLSNVTARPYSSASEVKALLSRQISNPVRWTESVQVLMGFGDFEFSEIGPGDVLTKLVGSIKDKCGPIKIEGLSDVSTQQKHTDEERKAHSSNNSETALENPSDFQRYFQCESSLVVGPVVGDVKNNISSTLNTNGFLAYTELPAGSLDTVKNAISKREKSLKAGESLSLRWQSKIFDHNFDQQVAKILAGSKVKNVLVSGFHSVNTALADLRLKTLGGESKCTLIALVDTMEQATKFLRPIPDALVNQLATQDSTRPLKADQHKKVMPVDAIVFSGDIQSVHALKQLRDSNNMEACLPQELQKVWIGSSKNIGAPSSINSALQAGFDFVLAADIFQCTKESENSEQLKQLLEDLTDNDFGLAPHPELFEFGVDVTVVTRNNSYRGVAKSLLNAWKSDLAQSRTDLSDSALVKKYFPKGVDALWAEIASNSNYVSESEKIEAEKIPSLKLTLLLRYMLSEGGSSWGLDKGLTCEKSMVDFNRWLNKEGVVSWKNRRTLDLAKKITSEMACG
ncbi:ACP S-malonyltransferase [Marinagarivorans cellulosilyticus]|uniref:[acyl-carrier-protein] S-malonyltransferase n=1 Tax=Marinagarivorans cellulosilyticus TaxID=2721545 RepID=A0AAN2BJI8_9GAMM|nr:ACP S-malonyltransferase [Marinagarivorans cellulosilyticus]BCD97038.1 trans-AT polyketide synthase, acyltransferase and oxidoreductase domains [Marinagarivorans cellulosilyticus]